MDPLFDAQLIPRSVTSQLPSGYRMRPLVSSDYDRGVLDVLKVLTVVGNISRSQFVDQFNYWKSKKDMYHTLVVLNEQDRVVGCGTVLVESKLIHECGKVGHIEDIAVAKDQQGKKLGLRIINALTEIGRAQGCYKIILDCSEHNVKFYEKCGFTRGGAEMVLKFQTPSKL